MHQQELNPWWLNYGCCSFEDPASAAEIYKAWPGGGVPAELIQVWQASRQARLFEDVEYGQWGLVLLSPAASAQRTAEERARSPGTYQADDVVIGELLGDQELVVLAPSGVGAHVLVALPLDDRADWYPAASDLAEFLDRYLNALGSKFWESR